ncbi:MAG: DNA translocase FtsK [Candidatus Pacebacteria bacterium]|jgi:S-DNA-T family DNA segregation ATPase FtsK/SpoIIIE|nr:DNA translocase FtsK [Candidatus Paceibacterota bacterium]
MKKNNSRNHKKGNFFKNWFDFELPGKTSQWCAGIALLVAALGSLLGFFDNAGGVGNWIIEQLRYAIGYSVFSLPVVLAAAGMVCFTAQKERFAPPLLLASLVFLFGMSGLLANFDIAMNEGGMGGYLGYWIAEIIANLLFGKWVAAIFFGGIILASASIFWWLLGQPLPDFAKLFRNDKAKEKKKVAYAAKKPSLISAVFNSKKGDNKPTVVLPKFTTKPVKPALAAKNEKEAAAKPGSRSALISKLQYKNPPLDLLDKRDTAPLAGDVQQNSAIIKKTLENFGIPVDMSPEIIVGPAVTQYALKPAEGIKLSKITTLSNDLALSLASSSIRIEAPIPGKSLVGVEVPNKGRAGVGLRDLLSTSQFTQSNSNLLIALGKDILGSPIYADIARMPHLLVAGATGTGKTIFLNSVLTSLLYRNPPEMLRLILVDPKRVEMRGYNNLPHLLTPVIYDVNKTVAALKWAIQEMNRRFDILGEKESRNINSYNEKCAKDGDEPLPYIVFLIDELADLMATKGKDIEAGIVRLAQMARAVGIHLIVATQRPSVEVITGLIKANITCRVAFQVASQIDSRTILDTGGAEKLLGAGDMLYMSAEYPKAKRIQGPYISEKESKEVLDWIKENNPVPEFMIEESVLESLVLGEPGKEYNGSGSMFAVNEAADGGFGDDPLYEQAKSVVVQARKASASFLQRRLRVGYARAARLMDILEERGVVGAGEGAKPRDVLISAADVGTQDLPGGLSGDVNDVEGGASEDGWQKV